MEAITIKHRNLPHWHSDCCIQFVTFHLADSLPASVRKELQEIKDEFLQNHPEPWSEEVRKKFNKMFPSVVNDYLDAGYGSCCLENNEYATIMANAIEYFDNQRYIIHRYVVMPNHVHALVELIGTTDLSQICKSWKKYSALRINRLMGQSGTFWHHESWDRLVRNRRHYENIVNYIDKNIREGGVIWR